MPNIHSDFDTIFCVFCGMFFLLLRINYFGLVLHNANNYSRANFKILYAPKITSRNTIIPTIKSG